MTAITSYRISDAEFASAIDKLRAFVEIPSVSHTTSPDYNVESLQKAADFCTALLKEIGFETRQVSIEGSAPYVLAVRMLDPSRVTILGYAHYDLQPVDREKWDSDPFVLTEREGRLYGRGASDDKGGLIALITALGAYIKEYGALPVNMKLLFEGEEEFGSSHMEALLKQEAESLKADALVIMDGTNLDVKTGTLSSSTRGLVNLTMAVKTMKQPVHSGVGCLIRDPSMLLAKLMVSLDDPSKIPGFLDGRKLLEPTEREILAKNSQTAEEYAKDHNLEAGETLRGDPARSVYERITEEPSITFINGGWGQAKGGNSVQAVASCEISVRLSPGQTPDRVAQSLKDHLLTQAAAQNIPLTLAQPEFGCSPFKADLSRPLTQKYIEALESEFGTSHAQPCGGSLPLLTTFQEAQPDMEMIVPGVEDPACNAHSHNESQDIGLLRKATNSFIGFLRRLDQ